MPNTPMNNFTLNRGYNPNAQFSVGNLVAFADAAGTAPVDGTGGAPTVTIARSVSSPLDGVASFLFTKDAANRQGEGFSTDVVLQPSDSTKILLWKFDYQITTGTYTGYQIPPLFSDLTLWFYDVTNAVMYQAIPYQVDGAVSTTNQYSITAGIQVPVGCLTGRFIWFLGNTSASAFTAKFNNIAFSRQDVVQPPPIPLIAIYSNNAGTSITASVTNMDYTTKVYANTSAWSGLVFTAPVTGVYLVSASAQLTGSVSCSIVIYKNSSIYAVIGVDNASDRKNGSMAVQLNQSETMSFRLNNNATLSNSASGHIMSIYGPGGAV